MRLTSVLWSFIKASLPCRSLFRSFHRLSSILPRIFPISMGNGSGMIILAMSGGRFIMITIPGVTGLLMFMANGATLMGHCSGFLKNHGAGYLTIWESGNGMKKRAGCGSPVRLLRQPGQSGIFILVIIAGGRGL